MADMMIFFLFVTPSSSFFFLPSFPMISHDIFTCGAGDCCLRPLPSLAELELRQLIPRLMPIVSNRWDVSWLNLLSVDLPWRLIGRLLTLCIWSVCLYFSLGERIWRCAFGPDSIPPDWFDSLIELCVLIGHGRQGVAFAVSNGLESMDSWIAYLLMLFHYFLIRCSSICRNVFQLTDEFDKFQPSEWNHWNSLMEIGDFVCLPACLLFSRLLWINFNSFECIIRADGRSRGIDSICCFRCSFLSSLAPIEFDLNWSAARRPLATLWLVSFWFSFSFFLYFSSRYSIASDALTKARGPLRIPDRWRHYRGLTAEPLDSIPINSLHIYLYKLMLIYIHVCVPFFFFWFGFIWLRFLLLSLFLFFFFLFFKFPSEFFCGGWRKENENENVRRPFVCSVSQRETYQIEKI